MGEGADRMPDGLYDADILLWSEAQADLLRRMEAGERVNAAIDWPNLIEEVEALGRSELNACSNLIRQALIHLLKLHAWPRSRSAGHWRTEILTFLAEAEQHFTPSMRQRIEVAALFKKAVAALRYETDDSGEPRKLPDTCPFTLDQLLADDVSPLWADRDG